MLNRRIFAVLFEPAIENRRSDEILIQLAMLEDLCSMSLTKIGFQLFQDKIDTFYRQTVQKSWQIVMVSQRIKNSAKSLQVFKTHLKIMSVMKEKTSKLVDRYVRYVKLLRFSRRFQFQGSFLIVPNEKESKIFEN